jgi:cyclopropane fatty-acyl-phospholipid synthase-like methyltransferase
MISTEEIKEYYDFSKLDYQIYNTASSDISMHFGLWDSSVHSHREALLNENKILSQIANIKSSDYVLDIGCGYGTTSIWLAKNIGCKVLGITISDKQVEEAKETAKRYAVDHLTDFRVMDFHNLEFPDNTFNKVIAIESVSHSSDKQKVIKEIYRVLKPEGIFVIADGFFAKSRDNLSEEEKKIAKICFEGVHVPPLAEQKEFENWLKEVGFNEVGWFDKTSNILRTSKRISNFGRLFLPLSKVLGLFGFKAISTSHVKAFIYQYYGWKDGMGVYGIFSATK